MVIIKKFIFYTYKVKIENVTLVITHINYYTTRMELFRYYTIITTSEPSIGIMVNGYKQGIHYKLENKHICYHLNNKLIKSNKYLDNTICVLWDNTINGGLYISWYNSRFLGHLSIYKGNKFHGLRFYWNIHGKFMYVCGN